jgi:hypothetical protein
MRPTAPRPILPLPREGTGPRGVARYPSSAASRHGRHPSRWANGETDPLDRLRGSLLSTSRRLRRVFALLLSASLLAITAGAVSAAASKPSISVSAGTPAGTITVSVNRAVKQIVSCTYGVDAIPTIDCTNPVGGSKSTTYTIDLTDASLGDHTVNVTVTLTDGGVGIGSGSFTITPPRVFVIAFTDGDGDHVYSEANDTLISKLVDTDGSNTMTVGDTVFTGAYPLDFAATTSANATVTTFPVTQVNPGFYQVMSGAAEFTWGDANPGAFGPERYSEATFDGFTVLQDVFTNINCFLDDRVAVHSNAPSQPNADVDITTCDTSDNGFLDITSG